MFSQSCVSGFHRISDRVESRARSRLSATTPYWRHIWSSTRTNDPTSFDHPHTEYLIVYLALDKIQISKGSPPPTRSWSQIPSSTRTNDPTSFDHPPTANTSPPSSTRQISLFYGVTASHPSTTHAHDANNHPYPQYTSHCSPTPSSFGGKSER